MTDWQLEALRDAWQGMKAERDRLREWNGALAAALEPFAVAGAPFEGGGITDGATVGFGTAQLRPAHKALMDYQEREQR